MYSKREIRIFIRCAIAQLRIGNESLAHGPLRVGTLDARPKIAYIKYRARHGGIVTTYRGILLRAWARELHRRGASR